MHALPMHLGADLLRKHDSYKISRSLRSLENHHYEDIVEFRDMEYAKEALDCIKKARKEKTILDSELEIKFKRIQSCKKRFLNNYKPTYIPSIQEDFNRINREEILSKLLPNT